MSNLVIKDEPLSLIPIRKDGEPVYYDLPSYYAAINIDPPKKYIRVNKHSNNAKYLPIRVVEQMLAKLYPFWKAKQLGEPKIMGNSVVISVTLEVYHPLIQEWLSYPGVGAVPIELDKGSDPTDFTKIKPKALHKNVPAALSFAVSNAAKKIGRVFGSHLNDEESLKL